MDPVRQGEEDGASMGPRRPRHAARRARAAIYLSVVLLSAMATLLALLVLRGMAHESARPVADPASASAAAPPSISDGGIAPQARVAPSSSPTVAQSPAVKPTSAGTTTRPASTANSSYEDQVVALTNQERAKAGCQALTVDSRLTAAARGHSQDMATRDYFDHNTPEGVTPWTRITNAGYHYSSAAENIAEGQATPDAVMTAWMNSPGHRENILNCGYRNIGVGLAYNAKHTPYWTQDFGTP